MAQFDQELRVADVYAEALFDLARDGGRVDEVRGELDELLRLFQAESDLRKFMTSPALESAARAAGLERLFRGRLGDLVLNTLLVMNEHGRCALVPALHRRYVLRQEAAADEVEVTVTSAVPLTDRQKSEAFRIAAELSGKRPLMEYEVRPEVLGGMILQIGELRLDNSLRRHLYGARAQLLERAQRGLNVGVER
jgi:F-type H+-transporting ATPase subunit delta